MSELKDQLHPQYTKDRQVVNDVLKGELTDRNLADLARLCIRYRGFPGARDIQADLLKALNRWGLSEEELFVKTREIHRVGKIFGATNDGRDDWA
jgi:hypothetical protein